MQKNVRSMTLTVLFILILLVGTLLVSKVTFSYFVPDIGDDVQSDGQVTASGDTLIFTKGKNLSLKATTDNFGSTHSNLTSTTNPSVKLVASSKTKNASTTYYAGINISSNTYKYSTDVKTAEIILTVLDENGEEVKTSSDSLDYVTVNGVSGFDITEKVGVFNIVSEHPIATTSTTTGITHTWTFTITFLNLEVDQSINEDGSLSMEAILQKNKIVPKVAFADYIKGLYKGQGENNLYLHDDSLDNGANDGSYRYAGSSETTNNFVCFGYDSTDGTCPTDNLYRIIGVFGENVKLIKYDYANSNLLGTGGDYNGSYTKSQFTTYKGFLDTINNYRWNYNGTSKTGDYQYGSNTWSTSLLNKTNLNTTFISSIGSTWSNKIATTTWKVGGNTWANIGTQNAKTAYTNEITSPAANTTVSAKVGLMYVSDYMYAASPTYWTYKGYDTATTDYRAAINDNWLYMGVHEWTIAPRTDNTYVVFNVFSTGSVNYYYANSSNAGNSLAVRPVLALESSITYAGGAGTSSEPYLIS